RFGLMLFKCLCEHEARACKATVWLLPKWVCPGDELHDACARGTHVERDHRGTLFGHAIDVTCLDLLGMCRWVCFLKGLSMQSCGGVNAAISQAAPTREYVVHPPSAFCNRQSMRRSTGGDGHTTVDQWQ